MAHPEREDAALGGVVRRLPNGVVKHGIFQMLMRRGHDDRRVAYESLDTHWSHYGAGAAGEALVRQMRALDVRDTLEVSPQLARLRGPPARVVWGVQQGESA